MADLVVCEGVSKTYRSTVGRVEALRGVDARFPDGAVTAVVGPSGSGKSTLLKVLAGLERISGGSVAVGDERLERLRPRRLRDHRRRVVTYVSQTAAENFLPELTIDEQLELTGRAGRGRAALDEFAIGRCATERPGALSGGEQARAAIALALARGTPLVISDEPTAELDEDSSTRVLMAIRAAAAAGTTFVIATHDDAVIAAADVVVRLDRGQVATAVEPPREAAAVAARAGDVVLAAEGVSKRFGDVQAVTDVTFGLPEGALGALVGRSGSGKSTLLSLLAGWQRPDSGIVRAAHADPAELGWRRLAYLPQRFGLIPELTVRGNVELPGRIGGGGARVDELLDRLGLTELADRLPAETSVGQQQRTALARALALRPALLLADEPTSHQDVGWREAVIEALQAAREAGTTSLIATHEQLVAGHATHVWQMASGTVVP